jgi:hypothetical protein
MTILTKKHQDELELTEEDFFQACREGSESAYKKDAVEARIGKKLKGGGFTEPNALYVGHIKDGEDSENHAAWARVRTLDPTCVRWH